MEAALYRRRPSDDKLANQLAAFGLLGRTNSLSTSTPKPAQPRTTAFPIPTMTPKRGYQTGFMPVSPIPPFNPIYVQGQGFRGWVFQSEPGRVRFIPVRPNVPVKQSGGTGVFLPRVSVKDEFNKRNNTKGREQRKPQKEGPNFAPKHELMGPALQPTSSAELASLLPEEWSY